MGAGCSSKSRAEDAVMPVEAEVGIKGQRSSETRKLASHHEIYDRSDSLRTAAGIDDDDLKPKPKAGKKASVSEDISSHQPRWELMGEMRSAREQFDRERMEQEMQLRGDLTALQKLAEGSRDSSNDSEVLKAAAEESETIQPSNRDQRVIEARFGIRAQYLRDLVKEFGHERMCGMTTREFAEHCIKPKTADTLNAYVQEFYDDPDQRHKVGIAQVAVSHAWDYQVLDLLDAIEDFLDRDKDIVGKDPVLWLDFLSVSQHTLSMRDHEELGIFYDAIGRIGKLVIVLTPFDAPTALSRAWVIMEALACIANRGELYVAFPKPQRIAVLEAVKKEPMFFSTLAAKVRTGVSDAVTTADRNAVFAEITRRGYPFWQVDKMVLGALDEAACEMLKEETNREKSAIERGRLLKSLGEVLLGMGKGAEGREELEEAVEVLAEAEGKQGPNTLKARLSLGVARGGDEAQLKSLQDALERSAAAHGPKHRRTLTARNNIAQALSDLGMHEQALDEHQAVLKGMIEAVGREHPSALASLHNTGTALYNVKEYDAAAGTLKGCLKKRKKVLGVGHTSTGLTMFWLGVVYEAQHKYVDAESMFEESLAIFRKTLGESHRHTRDTKSWLSSVQWGMAEV